MSRMREILPLLLPGSTQYPMKMRFDSSFRFNSFSISRYAGTCSVFPYMYWNKSWNNLLKQTITNVSFLFACILPSFANAIEISYSNVNPFGGADVKAESILLKGEIKLGDYLKLLNFIRRDQDRYLRSGGFILASPGGDVQESLKIAHFIKGSFSYVSVGQITGPCVSACFLIYVTAQERDADDHSLGIHRPYFDQKRLALMSPGKAEEIQNNALKQARLYLETLNVPTNLIDKMFQHASSEVYWLSREEIDVQIGRRPPWYEQYLIAKCGLDKSLEHDYFTTNNQAKLDKVMAIEKCVINASHQDAIAFISSELYNHNNF